jgi:thiamine transporter
MIPLNLIWIMPAKESLDFLLLPMRLWEVFFMSVEQFSEFFMSSPGMITAGAVIVALAGVLAYSMRSDKRLSVKALTYAAICIALAMVLSNVKLWEMPNGGTLTACSMVFVSLIGYWFGPTAGITAAVSYGLLQLIIDPYVVHPMQLIMDYPLAFGMLGVSGFFYRKNNGLYTGYILGALLRGLCSTLSGVIFFAEYAGDQNVFVYSFLYNMSYISLEMVITLAVLSFVPLRRALEHVKSALVTN